MELDSFEDGCCTYDALRMDSVMDFITGSSRSGASIPVFCRVLGLSCCCQRVTSCVCGSLTVPPPLLTSSSSWIVPPPALKSSSTCRSKETTELVRHTPLRLLPVHLEGTRR